MKKREAALFIQIACLIFGALVVNSLASLDLGSLSGGRPPSNRAALDNFQQVSLSSSSAVLSSSEISQPSELKAAEDQTDFVRGSIASSDPEHLAKTPYPGYTVYGTSGTAEVVVANLQDEFIHRWPIDADRVRLLPNCNLLAVHGSKWGLRREPWASLRSVIREYTWKGKVVREIPLPDDAHHDIVQMKNGNLLVLYLTNVPKQMVKSKLGSKFQNVQVRSDVIAEIDSTGKEVWRWRAHDHLDMRDCGARTCPDLNQEKYISGKELFDWTHINTIREIPSNRWFDEGDERFRPGNIIIMARNFWTSMIIDRESGEVVWKFHGTANHSISGGHESHMIEPHLPGAGNVLIFDNGRVREESSILEVNPVTKEIVWEYSDGKSFFSKVAGAAQRLANGNTLISEDGTGRIFEVNKRGEEVWSHHAYQMRINRAYRYSPGYCQELPPLG